MRTFALILSLTLLAAAIDAASTGKAKRVAKAQGQVNKKHGERYPEHPGKNKDNEESDFNGDTAVPKNMPESERNFNTYWPKWNNAQVPYLFDTAAGFTASDISTIENALADLSSRTGCISFPKLTSPPQSGNYIKVTRAGGCWSYLGSVAQYLSTSPYQTLSLDYNCVNKGTVQHEFMHALGVNHEQTRMDRDDHIIINWENIEPGRESNFEKQAGETPLGYDHLSVMQYDWWAFSKDWRAGLATITKLDGSTDGLGSDEATDYDIQLLQQFYCS